MRRALFFVVLAGCNGGTTPGPISTPDGGADANAPADAGANGRVNLVDVTAPFGLRLRWVAFNDGDGPWQVIPGPGPGYSFEARTGRYGLAFVCATLGPPAGEVIHATVAELSSLTVDCGQAQTGVNEVSGKVAGVPAGATAWVQLAGSFQQLAPAAAKYSVFAPDGTYDLGLFASIQGRATHALVRRDLVIDASKVVDLDLAAEGTALVRQPLRVTGGPAGPAQWSTGTSLITAHDTFTWGDQDGASPASYAALPGKAVRPQEYQQLETGVAEGTPEAQQIRGVIRVFREPAALDVALPAPFTSPRASATRGASGLLPRVTFEHYPGALYYQLVALQVLAGGTAEQRWLAIVSKGWLGDATTYELPDWSAVPGFDAGLKAKGLFGETDAVISNRDFARTINDDPATRDGSELKYARLSFVLDGP